MIAPHDVLIEEAMAQIGRLFSYRRRAFCAQPLSREVSLPQVHLLMTLQERGPTTISALAHLLGISAPSASAIVDRLEEHDLALRERDAEDRRVVHVRITEHGRTLVAELMGMKREQVQRLLDAMTAQELSDVIKGIAAVCNALDRSQTGADMGPGRGDP